MSEGFIFEFKQIDDNDARATVAAWREQVEKFGDIVNPSYYRMIFDWVLKTASNGGDPGSYAYGLFKPGGQPSEAQALLAITHAGEKSDAPWLKLLSLYVSPEYDAESETRVVELGQITVQAIIESFELTFDKHPSDSLKICSAGSTLDRGFLRGLSAQLNDRGIRARMSGNWLICERPKG
ncbi:MAG: hypothetical protein HQL80_11725 [Magnetococcales bacterium]|nr:hypothetical protein [Magnetococcales bacterium]